MKSNLFCKTRERIEIKRKTENTIHGEKWPRVREEIESYFSIVPTLLNCFKFVKVYYVEEKSHLFPSPGQQAKSQDVFSPSVVNSSAWQGLGEDINVPCNPFLVPKEELLYSLYFGKIEWGFCQLNKSGLAIPLSYIRY